MSIALRTIIMEGRKKMENKLQPSQPGALQAQTPNTTFNLPGNNNTLVAHTDAVNNTYIIVDLLHWQDVLFKKLDVQ